MARPSKFTPVLAERILSRIERGESLRKICESADMPAASTVFKWLSEDDKFSEQYAHAREAQAEGFAEEIVHIADTETDAAKARNRIDARKWVASKLLPKKYGDKVEVNGRLTWEQLVAGSQPPTE